MNDDVDPVLAQAFARSREPLADAEFLQELISIIERERQKRLWWRLLAMAAVVMVVVLNMGPLLEIMASAVRLAGEVSQTSTDLVISPWGWGASTVLGLWIVLRTRPSRG